MMDGTLVALVFSVLVIAAILYFLINFTGPRHPVVDKKFYQSAWLDIEQAVDLSSSESMQMAIIKADKLVDRAMRDIGVSGKTMAERLKSCQGQLSNVNILWSAHRLRNQIAHEASVKLSRESYRRAMTGFRQALKDLGTI